MSSKGYLRVTLYKDGSRKNFLIHRLIATHFIPNPENKPQVNHIDGNKINNNIDNLEWVTPSENTQHAYDTGLQGKQLGESNGGSILTIEDVKFIKENYKPRCREFSGVALAKRFGVSKSTIRSILSGRTWAHV